MKAIYWFLMLLLINTGFLDAQDLEQNFSSQLTSKIWMEGKEHIVAFKFNADGTFFKTLQSPLFSPVDFMGKWEWLSQDTFTMQTTQKIIDGQIEDLNPEPYHKRVIHIRRIDNRLLRGITHNILVNQDSEYAYQFEWTVKN